jgi:hypothetical protein
LESWLENSSAPARPDDLVEDALVSARFLVWIFDSAYLLALAAWVGSILFCWFSSASMSFSRVCGQERGHFVPTRFPRYYAWGAIAGAIALPAYVAVPLCYPEYRGAGVGLQSLIILLCILVALYAANSLIPAINAARDAGPSGQVGFERLKRRFMRLNCLMLAAGLGLLISFASRPAPRTSGIIELSPGERARFDADLDQVIAQVETKYGFRRNAGGSDVTESPARVVDPEMVKELESYYEQKRLRDLSRKQSVPAIQGAKKSVDTIPRQPKVPPPRESGGPGGG